MHVSLPTRPDAPTRRKVVFSRRAHTRQLSALASEENYIIIIVIIILCVIMPVMPIHAGATPERPAGLLPRTSKPRWGDWHPGSLLLSCVRVHPADCCGTRGSHVSLPQGSKSHCNNEMNVTLARLSLSFCETRAMPRRPVVWPGFTWLRTRLNASLLEHAAQHFRCRSKKLYCRLFATLSRFLQQQQQQLQKRLCKWDKMQRVLFTCKNTEGKSSNNVAVGFCCLFICRQAENRKIELRRHASYTHGHKAR